MRKLAKRMIDLSEAGIELTARDHEVRRDEAGSRFGKRLHQQLVHPLGNVRHLHVPRGSSAQIGRAVGLQRHFVRISPKDDCRIDLCTQHAHQAHLGCISWRNFRKRRFAEASGRAKQPVSLHSKRGHGDTCHKLHNFSWPKSSNQMRVGREISEQFALLQADPWT